MILSRKASIFHLLFLFTVALFPQIVSAQTVSIKMDVRTLNALLIKYGQTSYHLSGPFTAESLKITKIKKGVIYGSFDLEFDGTITIPIPFWGRKKVGFVKKFSMNMRFSPTIKNGTLNIPVKTISVSGSGMSLSLGSKTLGAMVTFKRWLFSSSGQGLLNKKFSIDFKFYLNKYLAKRNWKIKLSMGQNHINLTGHVFRKSPPIPKTN